jgi:hypothetical protein
MNDVVALEVADAQAGVMVARGKGKRGSRKKQNTEKSARAHG